MKKKYAMLNTHQKFTITHCMRIAAEKFTEDAKVLRDEGKRIQRILDKAKKKKEPAPMVWMTPAAAERLAQQLEQQAKDALQMRSAVEDSDEVVLVEPPEDEELETTDRV